MDGNGLARSSNSIKSPSWIDAGRCTPTAPTVISRLMPGSLGDLTYKYIERNQKEPKVARIVIVISEVG